VSTLTRIQRRVPLIQLAAVVVVFVYGFQTIYGFGSRSSINTMLVLAALLGLAALGQTLVMILGGLDLSIPGFIVFGSVIPMELSRSMPFGVAIALTLLVTAAVGAAVGLVVARKHLQPLVLTLAVGSVASGLALAWTASHDPADPPAWITQLTSPVTETFGVPFPPLVVVWAVVAIVAAIVLHRLPLGRRFFAAGANGRAAALALVRTDRLAMAVFALSACGSVIVGTLLAGFAGSGDPGLGDPYLFQGLAAIIIGGTAFFGARGDYTHTVLGALLMVELTTVLIGKGLSNSAQQILFGALILLVVALYGRQPRVRDRV
jgi:ribose transport system permease protein